MSLVTMCAVCALAVAQGPGQPAAAERLGRLAKDRPLAAALTDGAVALAGEADPLKRAEISVGLAGQLAAELREAAGNLDEARSVELADYYSDLVTKGVARNVATARAGSPPVKPEAVGRIVAHVREISRPVETRLEASVSTPEGSKPGMARALIALQEARRELTRAAGPASGP